MISVGINKKDLILTIVGVGVILLITTALTVVTLLGAAGVLTPPTP
jgi:hypothetical protein